MGLYMPSVSCITLRITLASLCLLTACSGGDDDARTNDCIFQDLYGPNFRCPGARRPAPLQLGDDCWGSGPNPNSEYRVEHHGIKYRRGRSCAPELYCNPVQGCQPKIGAGEPCDDVPPDALWGTCQDEGHACYPAEPLRDGDPPGPRVCRPLPNQPGEWCAADVKPDCDAYAGAPGASEYGPAHAWIRTGSNPQAWSGQTFNGQHLTDITQSTENYPALRVHELICQDQRCTPPPSSGESCAFLAPAQTYSARGALAAICQQPPEFTVNSDTRGMGWGARYDFEHVVLCLDGVCTPRAELPADQCVSVEAGQSGLDPEWCTTTTAACDNRQSRCLSPCLPDGGCGMCKLCESFDGMRWPVDGREDCAPDGDGWTLDSGKLIADQRSRECGYTHEFTFRPNEPITGDLGLSIRARGALKGDSRTFEVYVNDTYLETWQPDVDCIGNEAQRVIDIPDALHQASTFHVELRGSPSVCATCVMDSNRCNLATEICPYNYATIKLENRSPRYLGPVRDDSVCHGAVQEP